MFAQRCRILFLFCSSSVLSTLCFSDSGVPIKMASVLPFNFQTYLHSIHNMQMSISQMGLVSQTRSSGIKKPQNMVSNKKKKSINNCRYFFVVVKQMNCANSSARACVPALYPRRLTVLRPDCWLHSFPPSIGPVPGSDRRLVFTVHSALTVLRRLHTECILAVR